MEINFRRELFPHRRETKALCIATSEKKGIAQQHEPHRKLAEANFRGFFPRLDDKKISIILLGVFFFALLLWRREHAC